MDGTKNYSYFASGVQHIGEGLSAYSESVADVNSAKIQETAPAVGALIEATNKLENSGGLDSIMDGSKDYSGFAANAGKLGEAIKSFHDNVNGVSPAVVTGVANATNDLAGLVKNCAGIDTSGIQNLSDTIKNIGDMGLPILMKL